MIGLWYFEAQPNPRLTSLGVDVREGPLVPQTLDEGQPEPLIVEVAIQIEDVGLDDRAIDVAEGRTKADVGDGRVKFLQEPQPRQTWSSGSSPASLTVQRLK